MSSQSPRFPSLDRREVDTAPVAGGGPESPEFRNRLSSVGSGVTLDGALMDELCCTFAADVRKVVASTLRRRHSSDHDDVCQIVFKKIVEAFRNEQIRFDGSGDVGAYVRVVARNVSLEWHRRRPREDPVEDLDKWPLPERQSVLRYDLALVVLERWLLTASRELREVHHLRFVRGYSQHRAASALGMSRQQLRTLETRLKQQIRLSMLDLGLEL